MHFQFGRVFKIIVPHDPTQIVCLEDMWKALHSFLYDGRAGDVCIVCKDCSCWYLHKVGLKMIAIKAILTLCALAVEMILESFMADDEVDEFVSLIAAAK